jgi:SpoVK/Ycf46/Vps4 family AAA+-type ATPase
MLESIRHHEQLLRAGASQPNRMLIYGPPGTGKTQTARWIAGQLNLPLLTVRCDTLVSSLLGQTSKNLRRVFEHAEQRECVLFLDEFDALAGARGNERDVGELQRVVISLLQNIDALAESTILVASTNHQKLLDPAVWRRFSFQLPMPMPDAALRALIWKKKLGEFAPIDINWTAIVERSEGVSGALIEQVCLDTKRTAVLAREATVDETELFRRLALTMALLQGQVFSSIDDEIRWLRHWDTKRFSLRELARVYGLSIRNISNTVKVGGNDGHTKDSEP